MPPDVALRPEDPADHAAVERLYAIAFGPGRFTRTAFLIRAGVPHDPATSFVAERRGLIIGAIRQVPAWLGETRAFLLGPLAVAETAAKQGIGRALLKSSLTAADAAGAAAVVLVGDAPFYRPSGFRPVQAGAITLSGPTETHRLLVRASGALPAGRLCVRAWPATGLAALPPPGA